MHTRIFKVAFKRAPNEMQEVLDFKHPDAANAFAYKIELDGGVAVVVSENRSGPIGSVPFNNRYDKE